MSAMESVMRLVRSRLGSVATSAALVCGFLTWCAPAFALNPALDISQYAHTSWKIRDGFTKGTINAIAQTPDGYLWLGTEFGLLRFDGVRSVPWRPPAGAPLPSEQIFNLLAARDGTLWIGTAKGLASWKDGVLTRYPELDGQFIFRFLEGRDGAIWVGGGGVENSTLCVIEKRRIRCEGDRNRFGLGIFGLYEDSRGSLWVGSEKGLWRWRPGIPQLYSVPSDDAIDDLGEAEDGTLMYGTRNGLRRLVGGKSEPYAGPMRNVQQPAAAPRSRWRSVDRHLAGPRASASGTDGSLHAVGRPVRRSGVDAVRGS